MKFQYYLLIGLTAACSPTGEHKQKNTSLPTIKEENTNTSEEDLEEENLAIDSLNTEVIDSVLTELNIENQAGDIEEKENAIIELVEEEKETPPTTVPDKKEPLETAPVSSPTPVASNSAPVFPGGSSAMKIYQFKNLNYPERAKQIGLEGKVYVRFTVDANGDISKVRVIKGVDQLLDDAAVSYVKGMPTWVPARKDGAPMKDEVTLPIEFKLR